jgi:hypothetical protein
VKGWSGRASGTCEVCIRPLTGKGARHALDLLDAVANLVSVVGEDAARDALERVPDRRLLGGISRSPLATILTVHPR